MMKSTMKMTIVALGIFALSACSGDAPLAPANDNSSELAFSRGIPTEELNLVSFKSEVLDEMRSLNKKGAASKVIKWQKGGIVGGKKTYGNKVEVPAYSLNENTRISVKVVCEGKNDCGAAVDFLPDMLFESNVTITLSYDALDFDGNPDDLKVYWLDEDSGLWVEVENPILDEGSRTVSVQVDHFTRYAWSI